MTTQNFTATLDYTPTSVFNQDTARFPQILFLYQRTFCLTPDMQKKEYCSKSHFDDSSLLLQRRLPIKTSPPTLTVNFKSSLMVQEKVLTFTEITFHTPTSCIISALLSSSHTAFHQIQNPGCGPVTSGHV